MSKYLARVNRKRTLWSVTAIFYIMLLVPILGYSEETQPDIKVKEIVGKLKEYYAAANDYQADFVQTSSHRMWAGKLERAYGKVKFKSGGNMRWEYERPEKKLFIYDGQTLWVYEPEVPQVLTGATDTDRLRKALAFLTGEGDILKEYQVKKLNEKRYGLKKGIILGLTPNEPGSPFKRIELYLDDNTFRVVRSVIVDHEGNRNRFDFMNPRLNSELSEKIFKFTPPKGVPVIEAPK